MDFFRTPTGFTYGIRVSLLVIVMILQDPAVSSSVIYSSGFFFLMAGRFKCKGCTAAR